VAEAGAVVVGRIGNVKVMVVDGEGYCYVVEGVADVDVRWWRRWVGIWWMLHLMKWRFLNLFMLA
jgi:hypothetical protein